MKAVYLREHGDLEVLTYGELAQPEIKPNEVLVKIKAVALNHLDLWIRQGLPHIKHEYPLILGSDIVGEVAAVGELVDDLENDLEVGKPIMVHPGLSCGHCAPCSKGWDNLCGKYQILGEHVNGGYCEYIALPRKNCLPFPQGLSWEEAACMPLVYLTAWQMLVTRANIQPGQVVLVHGASSGMGTAGIQIAKLFNCTVITTAGSDDKLEKAKELGADFGINYKTQDVLKTIESMVGKQKVDIVFEHIGQALWDTSLRCLKWGGILVTCGATTGHQAKTDLRQIFFRQIQVLGSTLGQRGLQFDILPLIEQGKLKPVLDQVFDLKDARQAQERLAKSEQFGKIVLRVS